MNKDIGSITLIVQQQCCSSEAIGQMMAVAEHQEPGEPTLRLVKLEGSKATIAMVQQYIPGERMRLVENFKQVPGVQAVG